MAGVANVAVVALAYVFLSASASVTVPAVARRLPVSAVTSVTVDVSELVPSEIVTTSPFAMPVMSSSANILDPAAAVAESVVTVREGFTLQLFHFLPACFVQSQAAFFLHFLAPVICGQTDAGGGAAAGLIVPQVLYFLPACFAQAQAAFQRCNIFAIYISVPGTWSHVCIRLMEVRQAHYTNEDEHRRKQVKLTTTATRIYYR